MNSNVLVRPRRRAILSPTHALPAYTSTLSPKRGMELVDLLQLGIVPGVGGGARGINTEGDVVTQTTDGRDLNDMWAEFQQTMTIQNEERNRIIQFLTFPVTNVIEDVAQVVGDDFEEASEFGEPKSIRPLGSYFSLSYSFKWYDLAARYTWKFLAEADARQVEAINNAALEAHNRLIFTQVLRTIFNASNLVADIRGQAYTVYKFYNGDGTIPPTYKSNTFSGTHTHYLTSGAAQIDPGDIEDQMEHLRHHGYEIARGYRIVFMVNSAQGKAIRTFRANVNGATYDFIPARSEPGVILPVNAELVGGQQVPNELAGLHVIGTYGNVIVVEDDYIPPGYSLMFATGGPDNMLNPVGFREHANPGLRGLRLVKGPNADYPLIDSFYNVGFGTGIRQRGGGVVYQYTASASYTPPPAYV